MIVITSRRLTGKEIIVCSSAQNWALQSITSYKIKKPIEHKSRMRDIIFIWVVHCRNGRYLNLKAKINHRTRKQFFVKLGEM